jgi:hypothetical protein
MEDQAQRLLPRIYRRHPDSSSLAIPRVFARAFCQMSELAKTVKFYETIAGLPSIRTSACLQPAFISLLWAAF